MSKHLGATAWLCWLPASSWPAFLRGPYVRKLPWAKCFPGMSRTGTGFGTTSKTGGLPAMPLLWPLAQAACLVCKSAREGLSREEGPRRATDGEVVPLPAHAAWSRCSLKR